MIELEARVSRVLLRARHLGADDALIASLAAALRGGGRDARAALDALVATRGLAAAAGMLSLAFGGPSATPDAAESAALALWVDDPARLDALLDHVDPAAPCWAGLSAWLNARGRSHADVIAALVRRSAVWLALDGGVSSVGVALREAIARAPHVAARALAKAAGDAGAVTVTRAVRAMLAPPSEPDDRLLAFVRALPQGLRGAAADPLLALCGARFVDAVCSMARGEGEAASLDRVAALEALLRHAPGASSPFIDEVFAPASGAPVSLRAEVLRAHGPAEPSRFAARAVELAAHDPGEWAGELAAAWPFAQARPLWEALLGSGDPSLVARAAEALLSTPHPSRGRRATELLRDPGVVGRERVVEACAALADEELGGVIELLEERASELRLAAVRVLAGRGDSCAEALVARHANERAPRVRAAIVSALGYEPGQAAGDEVGDPFRAAVLARAEAARVAAGRRPPRWIERCDVSLRWDDGREVPPSVGVYLVRMQSLRGAAEPDPEVVEIATRLDPLERVLWAESLLDAWIAADAPAKDHGALLLAALLGGEFAVRALREVIPLWHKGSRRSMAATGVQLLAMRASSEALRALDAFASGHAHESFGALASAALDEEARSRGLSVELMIDRCAPDFGFTGGTRRFELGHHTVCASIEGGSLTLTDGGGEPLSAAPRPTRRDDPRRVAELRRALKLLHHALPEAVARETARLVDAMGSCRVWARDALAWSLAHPVVGRLYRGLWWRCGTALVHGSELAAGALSGDARLAHPAMDEGVEDRDEAPFAQMARAVARCAASEAGSTAWRGFEGRWLVARGERHARSQTPWAAAGWTPGTVDEGRCRAFSLRFHAARVEAVLSVEGIALWSESERRSAVGGVSFVRDGGESLTLGAVSAAMFSEAVTRAEAMLAGA